MSGLSLKLGKRDRRLTVQEFADIYVAIRREVTRMVYNFPHLGEKETVKDILEWINENNIDPIDFMRYAIKYYTPVHIFPSLLHLKNEKLRQKYLLHQKLRGIYHYHYCNVCGDSVYIPLTGEVFPTRTFWKPLEHDERYLRLKEKLQNGERIDETDPDVVYLLAKCEYLKKPIPEELIPYVRDDSNVPQRQEA